MKGMLLDRVEINLPSSSPEAILTLLLVSWTTHWSAEFDRLARQHNLTMQFCGLSRKPEKTEKNSRQDWRASTIIVWLVGCEFGPTFCAGLLFEYLRKRASWTPCSMAVCAQEFSLSWGANCGLSGARRLQFVTFGRGLSKSFSNRFLSGR